MSNKSVQNNSSENQPRRETKEVANAHPLSRFFFLKTTFAILLTVLLCAGGFAAYSNLVKESIPDLEIPIASVTTAYPGADPQTIEEQVTQVIEDELSTLKGLKSLASASFDSFSVISVEFEANADSKEAMQKLRESVSDAESQLPRDVESPDILQVSASDAPIMTVTLYGDADDTQSNRLARDLQDRLETISGISEVNLGGARDEIIQVLLEPQRLLALGISPTQVQQAITSANLEQPFGEIESEDIGAVIRLAGTFRNVEELRTLPIVRLGEGPTNKRPVRLGEIGTVERKLDREESRAYFSQDGEEFGKTIEISIKKSPGADTVNLIADIEAQLAEYQSEPLWPEGVKYSVTQNQATQITDSLSGVLVNGLQAMLGVFVILLIILTWREGVVAGLSIPVSFAGTLILIWALGYTLNELVIIGMVLSLGLIVDVFILMMEGIHEEIYTNKKTFGQSALSTVKRYGMPAFAGQMTTILALAPLMAISGTSGKFIRVLPVTAIACLVMAFAVALLISVPLSRYLLGSVAKGGAQTKETRSDIVMSKMSGKLKAWSLKWTLLGRKRAGMWVASVFGLFIVSMFLATKIPMTLYPATDGVNIGINVELPAATELSTSQQVAEDLGEILRGKPYMDNIIMLVGRKSPLAAGGIGASLQPTEADSFLGFSIKLKEREDREDASFDIVNDIRDELEVYLSKNVPGATLLVAGEASGPSTGDPIEVVLTGSDMSELQRLSKEVQDTLKSVEGTSDVRDNLGSVKTEISLTPDREAVDFYGLSQQDLAAQIRFALSNDKIGSFTILGPEDDLDIRMGLAWSSQNGESGGPSNLSELSMIRAFTPEGETVALLSLLRPEISESPTSIVHKDGERALTVLSKVQGRNLNDILAEATPLLDEMKETWPAGYTYSIGGESAEAAETFGSAGLMLMVALVMVFGLLVIVFGSFGQAVILMATMPLALIGTFLGFFVFQLELSFFAVIGVISLIGIVANNGIVMVDTMNTLMKEGANVIEAAADGAAARLRPVITTSITTVVGLLPLAFGSPMYAPLCYAIIFGLIASTLLSLVIVPCLYVLLTKEGRADDAILD